jgi:hypothetical protein
MSDLHTASPPTSPVIGSPRPTTARTIGRWMVSFAGYPLGGYAVFLTIGHVDGPGAALAGGLLTGLILGVIQAWALGQEQRLRWAWTSATGAGLMAGVVVGAGMVGYRTDLRSLVIQGAVSGALLGIAQAAALFRRLGAVVFVWPFLLGGTFAVGWAVTTLAGIDVDQQFTVFGSSGALVAALLTCALPLALNHPRTTPTGAVS